MEDSAKVTTSPAQQRWSDAPTLYVVAPHCLHCGSVDVFVVRSESNGDESRTRKYVCHRCKGKTKVCVEMPDSGKVEMDAV